MHRIDKKYQLDGCEVFELINGNWIKIASFYDHKDGVNSAESMAADLFQILTAFQ